MLLKLAFIALNFGYLEFALQVVDAAGEAKPDPDLRDRLLARDCYRLLYDLKKAVSELPAQFPHFDRSKMIAERKVIIDRAQSHPIPVEVAPVSGAAPATPMPVAEAPVSATGPITPPSPHSTPVESVLESYGYVWWADVVRRRRKSAEHCVPGRMY
jgi:hypothetical protein